MVVDVPSSSETPQSQNPTLEIVVEKSPAQADPAPGPSSGLGLDINLPLLGKKKAEAQIELPSIPKYACAMLVTLHDFVCLFVG